MRRAIDYYGASTMLQQIGQTFSDIDKLPLPIAIGALFGFFLVLAMVQATVIVVLKMIFREAVERHKIIEAAALGVALAGLLYTA